MILFNTLPDFDIAWNATKYRVIMGGFGDDTIMVIAELFKRGYEPDEIVFCDTGSEFPHTYEMVEYVKTWCESMQWSKVTVLNKLDKNKKPLSVIGNCEKNNTLPAVAFGVKSCSLRFKTETADKYFNNNPAVWNAWGVTKKGTSLKEHTGSILRIIGINADEAGRADSWSPQDKWIQIFPLIEWDIGDHESDAVKDVGLYYPGKSSCVCCPNLTGGELNMMKTNYPKIYDRVQLIEIKYIENKPDFDIGPKGLHRGKTMHQKLTRWLETNKDDTVKCNTCVG